MDIPCASLLTLHSSSYSNTASFSNNKNPSFFDIKPTERGENAYITHPANRRSGYRTRLVVYQGRKKTRFLTEPTNSTKSISSAQRSTWWCGPSERCRSSRCRTRTRPAPDRCRALKASIFNAFRTFVVGRKCWFCNDKFIVPQSNGFILLQNKFITLHSGEQANGELCKRETGYSFTS